MTKNEMVSLVSQRTGFNKKLCFQVINCMFCELKRELLTGQKILITGFGKFYVKKVNPRLFFSPTQHLYFKTKSKGKIAFLPSSKLNFELF